MIDTETEESYLQRIEEFIIDQDKIVTVTWLSHKLNISANDSRHLLSKYVVDHRSIKPTELAVVYLLSAVLQDGTLTIGIIKEDEIDEKTALFSKVIDKQIYSVQKYKQVDFVPTSLIDRFEATEINNVPIKDAIVSSACSPRTFKVKKALPLPPAPVVKGKMSVFLNAAKKDPEPVGNSKATKSGVENTSLKKEKNAAQPVQKKNGITSFFTQSTAKLEITPKVEKQNAKEEVQSKKNNVSNKVSIDKQEVMEVDEPKVVKNDKVENKHRLNGLVDSDSEEDNFKPTQVKENTKSENKTRKRCRKTNGKTTSAPKRLKRTVQQDSDSDDIFGNDESEENFHQDDVIENSEEESQQSQKVKVLPPKNKKRKLVDKTYEDEEGFIITNKEWVEESPSEDEEKLSQLTEPPAGPPPVKEEKENTPKSDNKLNKTVNNEVNGKSAKGKGIKGKKVPSGNQTTLMSFFKKN